MNPSEREGADAMPSKSPMARPAKKKRSFLRFLLLLLSYLVVAAIVWKVADQWKMDPTKQQARAEQEVKTTVDKVSKLMLLPSIETELPQVAVINDAASLAKTQAFFADVKDGDQVLIYLKAQKAIIYRSSENKIVNVGPVIADNSGSAGTSGNSSASTPKSTPAPSASASSSSASSSSSR